MKRVNSTLTQSVYWETSWGYFGYHKVRCQMRYGRYDNEWYVMHAFWRLFIGFIKEASA